MINSCSVWPYRCPAPFEFAVWMNCTEWIFAVAPVSEPVAGLGVPDEPQELVGPVGDDVRWAFEKLVALLCQPTHRMLERQPETPRVARIGTAPVVEPARVQQD